MGNDSLTVEYQNILTASRPGFFSHVKKVPRRQILRNSHDRNQLWTKYIDMHMCIERILLDQGKAGLFGNEKRVEVVLGVPLTNPLLLYFEGVPPLHSLFGLRKKSLPEFGNNVWEWC